VVCCDLNPNVTSNEIDKTSNVDRVVQNPHRAFFIFIVYLFEEKYFVRTSDAKSLIKKQLHLPQIFLNYALISIFLQFVRPHSVNLSLSIDSKNFIPLSTIKAFIWKVQLIRIHNIGDGSIRQPCSILIEFRDTNYFSVFDVPHEVVVGQSRVVEEWDEDFVQADEAAGDVWILKDVNGHGIII
jgi:hypothetical protein